MSGENSRMHKAAGSIGKDYGFVPRSGQTSPPLSIMWRFLRERKKLFFGVLGVRLVKDLLPFQGPILVGIAADVLSGTDRTLLGWDLPQLSTRSMVIIVIAMVVLALSKVILGYIHTISSAHLGRHVVEAARRDLADATMRMALDDRRRFNSGDLLDRSLADSKGLRSFTSSVIIRMISNTVRAIYPVALMFIIDPILAAIVLAVIPLQFGVSNFLQRRLQRQTREARQRESEHTSSVKEAIDGWSSVASVGGQDWVAGELRATASASEDAKINKKKTTALISAVITIFTQLGVAILYLVGGWRIIQSGALNLSETGGTGSLAGALTLGTLVTFIGVAKKTYAPFEAYSKIAGSYRTGIVNLERVSEVLNASMIDARADGPELKLTDGTVSLENLTFSYDNAPEPVINDLTGTIPGRKLTVVTGTSGTGKTTLLRLIMGLDVPATGTVRIDGQDVNKARLSSVRRAIALVPQEPMLFSGSLGENLMLGRPDATTEDLLDACHKAGLLELVRELPNGLDTAVGSGRHMLSGGQLRRMAIARALLRHPALLLLDEPTAGLDQHHSEQVLDTLRRISSDTTVIMVSHRSLPLARSEHHLVLDGGSWTQGVAGRDTRLSTDNDHQRIEAPRIAATDDTDAHGAQNGSPTTAGHIASLVADPSTNGAHSNGTNGTSASDQVTLQTGHRVIGLSAMGRPIVMNSIARTESVASLFVVAGHRAGGTAALGELMPELLAGLAGDDIPVDVNAISNLNPDGAWTDDGRTILGIDLAADHHRRGATETMVMHRSISTVGADLILDVGYDATPGLVAADVDIAVRYRVTGDAATSAWMSQIAADLKRRLASSRFSFQVRLEPCSADSITAAWGTPVIELTAAAVPTAESGRHLDALTEAAVAVQGAAALSRPALAAT